MPESPNSVPFWQVRAWSWPSGSLFSVSSARVAVTTAL